MKKKSIKINALLSSIKTFLSAFFPLITFPYISRVIGVVNYGKINFVTSIITYFTMIAALGISSYAVREGAAFRDNKNRSNVFVSQMFTINMISSLVAYVLLALVTYFCPKMHEYIILLLIQSLGIISATISVEWIFTIYEDYGYITKRYIIIQLLSLILIFTIIRNKNDYYMYALITVGSNLLANIVNLIHSKKYVRIKLVGINECTKHLNSIFVLFLNEVSIQIYVNSDITLLGIFTDDYAVGIYSVAAKIYSIIKRVIGAVLTVATPRLANYFGTGKTEAYEKLKLKVIRTLVLVTIPMVIGIMCMADNVVYIVSGKEYIKASTSLIILNLALCASVLASLLGTLLLVEKKEKYVLQATSFAAMLNILLNIILLPGFGATAAAFTTAVSESFVVIMYIIRYDVINIVKQLGKKYFIELFLIIFGISTICTFTKKIIMSYFSQMIVAVFLSSIVYIIILYIMHEEILLEVIADVDKKGRKDNDR